MTPTPLTARWDREVIRDDDGTTTVCCIAEDGRPIALILDAEYTEALAGALLGDEVQEDDEYDPRTEVEAHWGGDPERLIAAWGADQAQQRQRIRALEAEIAILRAADTDPDDAKLTGIHCEPGHATVSLRPPELLMRAFIASMIDMLGDATNYVEMEASNPTGPGRYLVRVERAGGKSPHTLRREAEAQLAAARAQLDTAILFRVGDVRISRAAGRWLVGISSTSPRWRPHVPEELRDRNRAFDRARQLAADAPKETPTDG